MMHCIKCGKETTGIWIDQTVMGICEQCNHREIDLAHQRPSAQTSAQTHAHSPALADHPADHPA